ncbi:CHAT domain-containing protein [Nocardia sp. NPDC004860]|uniref:CHAT domain-containing protein n=1 Tax=Nocardia sp. NPDC004860 TaxID=3154557 RepID=UPI0033BDAE57
MAEASAAAGMRRQGAGVPEEILNNLDRVLSRAIEIDRQALVVSARDRVNFLRQLARGIYQWVELTSQRTGFSGSLDAEIRRARRRRFDAMIKIKLQIHRMAKSTIQVEDRLILIEIDTLTLGCDIATALKSTGPGKENLPKRRRRVYFGKADALARKAMALADAHDPERLYPGIVGMLARIFRRCEDRARARALIEDGLARCAGQPAGNVHLALWMLLLKESSSRAEELDIARRIVALLEEVPTPVYSVERAGYLTYVIDTLFDTVAGLALSSEAAAHRGAAYLSRRLASWCTTSYVDEDHVPIAHIFIAAGRAIVLIEQHGDVNVHSFPVGIDPLMDFARLSMHPPNDEITGPRNVRRQLSEELQPVLAVLGQYSKIRINPLRFATWIPWTGLKYTGDALGANRDIAWFNPFPPRPVVDSGRSISVEQPEGMVLVVDEATELAAGIVRVFAREPNAVITFNSRDVAKGLTAEQLQEACRDKVGLVMFCHASSDLYDYAEAGICTFAEDSGCSTRLTLRELAGLNLQHLRWAAAIACESGRPNTYLPATSVAHALVSAGVNTVVGTLWQITARITGPRLLRALLAQLNRQPDDLCAAFRTIQRQNPSEMLPLMLVAR